MPTKPRSPCTFCGKPAINRGRCARHQRGTTTARGYDQQHKRTRASYELAIKQGRVRCWRCQLPIRSSEPWDLGHDDNDRSQYKGAEHIACNRSAAAKRRNA